MSTVDLLSIGAFSLFSGLSINALRHYDEVGLLRPASVDPATGYRRYQPEQISRARLICALRAVDLPIDTVRDVLADPGSNAARLALHQHREQLLNRAHALTQMARTVDHYIDKGVTMPDLKAPRITQVIINVTDMAEAARFYQAAFDATYNEDISSFQFGTWPADDFFLRPSQTRTASTVDPPGHLGSACWSATWTPRIFARSTRAQPSPARPSTSPGNPGRRASSIPAGT
jgi:DNA-binding transcriptional MerR regulator